MSDLKAQMREDRAIRDAARALVEADVAQLKITFSGKSLAKRVTDRVSEGAQDIFEEAVEAADSNRGALATLIAAVVLWFAHNPIMSLFEDEDDDEADDSDESEPEAIASSDQAAPLSDDQAQQR